MTTHPIARAARARTAVLAVLAALVPAACGPGLEETWTRSDGSGSLELRPDGTAYVTSYGGTFPARYDVDGDRIVLRGPGGSTVLHRAGERLEGGFGTSFVRERARAGDVEER